jgi:hypothetical protein
MQETTLFPSKWDYFCHTIHSPEPCEIRLRLDSSREIVKVNLMANVTNTILGVFVRIFLDGTNTGISKSPL